MRNVKGIVWRVKHIYRYVLIASAGVAGTCCWLCDEAISWNWQTGRQSCHW